MGRKKVELKRIEDKSSRQVTFSKRRSGLIKKARELSVLCDVDVALLIFSTRGKLYDFSSQNNLEEVIKRYQKRYEHDESINIGRAECANSLSYPEILKVVQRCLGDLEPLSVADLGRLEKQLETALTQTRSRKTDVMMESLVSMQEQEKLLEAERKQLLKEIEAMEEENNLVTEREENDMLTQTQDKTLKLLHL